MEFHVNIHIYYTLTLRETGPFAQVNAITWASRAYRRQCSVCSRATSHMYKYLHNFPEDWFYNDMFGEFYMKMVLY